MSRGAFWADLWSVAALLQWATGIWATFHTLLAAFRHENLSTMVAWDSIGSSGWSVHGTSALTDNDASPATRTRLSCHPAAVASYSSLLDRQHYDSIYFACLPHNTGALPKAEDTRGRKPVPIFDSENRRRFSERVSCENDSDFNQLFLFFSFFFQFFLF